MKLTFLGDIMCLECMFEPFKENGSFDFSSLFEHVKPMFGESDYVIANLETPISTTNNNLTHERFSFCSPFEFAKAAKDAGIDFVSTANNHCLDRGVEGLKDTIEALNKIGLNHTGIFAECSENKPSIVEVNGLKLGIAAYTYGTNAFANGNRLRAKQHWLVNMTQNQELSNKLSRWCYYHRGNLLARIYNKLSEAFCPGQLYGPIYERRENSLRRRLKIKKDLQYLKNQNVDLSIALLHLGGQYNYAPTNSSKILVNSVLKWGGEVNIICGTHEHVPHNGLFERLRYNQIATYSLGNFNSMSGTFLPPYDKFADYSVAWHVYVNDNKKIEKSSFTILKTVAMAGGKISVRMCFDILKDKEQAGFRDYIDATQLLSDMSTVAFRFSGRRFTIDELTRSQELPIG